MRKMRFTVLGAVALLAALALPAAADTTIYSGIDIWWTPADGSTFFDFSQEPIPAGFFCSKSEPFTGRIFFKGVPVMTADGSLGNTDTIVQRLDDAVFDAKGVATTRVQVRALQFESIKPFKTACGKFNVRVSLDGDQPITRMRIIRDNEKGGHFLAPIAVRAKVSFTPARGQVRESVELTRTAVLPRNRNSFWSLETPEKALQRTGFVAVDTDADGRTDTFLPGTSNFRAGVSSNKNIETGTNEGLSCHGGDHGGHCLYPTFERPPAT